MTQHLYDKYYLSKPGFTGGTRPFRDLCNISIRRGGEILEIGAGPSNETTDMLAEIGPVTGVDIDRDVLGNRSCVCAEVFDGLKLPFPDNSFDACVSNWVLEHVDDVTSHFNEVRRVLRPGGVYCVRTTNLFHYVMMGSRLLPHFFHLKLANRLRKLDADAHDPYPTFYRANTRRKLLALMRSTGLVPVRIQLLEPEPSYGRAHAVLFFPMMAYERIVNSTNLLSNFRIIILGVCSKPE